jgi:multidrug transporter EmrE-like cation transporter
MKYFYLFLSVAFNVVSYLLYKSISNKQSDFLWFMVFVSGLIIGGINVLFFTKALKNIDLSIAYLYFPEHAYFSWQYSPTLFSVKK